MASPMVPLDYSHGALNRPFGARLFSLLHRHTDRLPWKTHIANLLYNFTETQITSGRMYERLAAYRIDNSFNPKDFTLRFYPSGKKRYPPFNWCRAEGDLAIVLCTKQSYWDNSPQGSRPHAAIGFTIIGLLTDPDLIYKHNHIRAGTLNRDDLYVDFMQRCSMVDNREELLNKLDWQKFLLETVAIFGLQCGFPRLVVQPAKCNSYLTMGQNSLKHQAELTGILKINFDKTCHRCGFKRTTNDPQEPFVLDLK